MLDLIISLNNRNHVRANQNTTKINLKNLEDSEIGKVEEHDLLFCLESARFAPNSYSPKAPAKLPEIAPTDFYGYEIHILRRIWRFLATESTSCANMRQLFDRNVRTAMDGQQTTWAMLMI